MEKTNVNFISNSGSSSRRNSERRRVSFPDSELVSYAEPRNPLTLAQNVTHEQVKTAYVVSCVKYHTHPIKTILDHISDFKLEEEQREQKFYLKDLMLTSEICETLEEIFRRVQFIEVEILNCFICYDAATALFGMMEYYDTTTKLKLNVSYTDEDQHGWEALKQYLLKSEALNSIEIFGMELTELQFNMIVSSLEMNNHLDSMTFKDCAFPVHVPMAFLAKKLTISTVKELHLAHLGLKIEDVQTLCNGIKHNVSLNLLDLSNNNIGDDGADFIFRSLCHKEPSSRHLTVLILWNAGLTDKLSEPLNNLLRNDYKLELLNIGYNQFKDEGMLGIEQEMSTNKSIARLGFQNCGLTDIGIEAASRIILQNKYLERLDFRGNKISLNGLQTFCNNFQQCDSVVTINFDKMPLDSSIIESSYISLLETINKKCEENKIVKGTVLDDKRKLASRKISLTCQTLNTQKWRTPTQVARTSSGRLRSPNISPLASPSTSRKPIVTKSRFQITVVSENQNIVKQQSKSRFVVSTVQDNYKSQEKTETLISNNNNKKDTDIKHYDVQTENQENIKPEEMEVIQAIELNIGKTILEQGNENNINNSNETVSTKNGIKKIEKISSNENDKSEEMSGMKLDTSDTFISEDKTIHLDQCLELNIIDQTDLNDGIISSSGDS